MLFQRVMWCSTYHLRLYLIHQVHHNLNLIALHLGFAILYIPIFPLALAFLSTLHYNVS